MDLNIFHVQVACDGGGGALGHPKVYINLDSKEVQTCPYCGMRFVFDPKAKDVDVRAACENPLGRCARAEDDDEEELRG